MNEFPKVSIVIATYNSEKVLGMTLRAIRNQTYPENKLEILVIDGGSSDHTLEIAEKYKCIVYNNPKTEPVNAKLIGLKNATGKYLVTVDHDEVIENTESIFVKVKALQEHPECKVALCSGYKRPANYPLLNQYISDFGDPFSLFIYNFPKYDDFFFDTLKKRYTLIEENDKYAVISFEHMRKVPLFELCCLGTMIDREYFLNNTNVKERDSDIVHFFYIMLELGSKSVIYVKQDPLIHYSVDKLAAYFPKLRWRICNNIHYSEKGENGFNGRINYQKNLRYKKILFIPYSLTLIFPLVKSIQLSITRRNIVYMLHPVFCLYVVGEIFYQSFLKIIGRPPAFKSYDGKSKINR